MTFNKYMYRIGLRLVLIFLCMFALSLVLTRETWLFSSIALGLALLLLVAELLHTIARTNRIVESLIESIRHGDFNRDLRGRAEDLGFKGLADSAQQIISAIAAAKIEKETQYRYLESLLEFIHTPVLTLNEDNEPELINPLALNTLGLYNTRKPTWEQIGEKAPRFAETVLELGQQGRKVIRLQGALTGKQLLVLVNSVRLADEQVRIVTFQDIEPEMEEKEMESWHTISRIMAHEIMNSLTPLSSLTETGLMLIEEEGRPKEVSAIAQQTIDNLHRALHTISDRNVALCKFIGNYRQLSRLPKPDPSPVVVAEMLREVLALYRETCKRRKIACALHPGPVGLTARLDQDQVKQVVINLLKNAIEAMEEENSPSINLSVKRMLDDVQIDISDTGPGISGDMLEKIFVPFFTTKPEGSGIGLSLSRQIIHQHGGQFSVHSEEGKGSTFSIILPL